MADEAAQNGGDPTAAAAAAAWAGRGYGGAPTGYGGAPQGYGGAPPAYNPYIPHPTADHNRGTPAGQSRPADTSPRDLRRVLQAQVDENNGITAEQYKAACLPQAALGEDYSDSKAELWFESKWNDNEGTLETGVWGFTTAGGGPIMQTAFGLCKFSGDTGGTVPNKVLGFLGDVDQFGSPPPFTTFPVKNTPRWSKVTTSWSDEEMGNFYEAEDARLKLRSVPRGQGTLKLLPRLIWLPGR